MIKIKKIKLIFYKGIPLIKFGIVGGINTFTSLIVYYLLLKIGIYYTIATIFGYIGSSILGYFLNKIWVFQVKQVSSKKSLIKYYIVYGTALIINLFCMYLWVQVLNISEIIAPVLTLCITIPYNFILSKLWVFKKQKKEGK